jgi:hypothetical protein
MLLEPENTLSRLFGRSELGVRLSLRGWATICAAMSGWPAIR